MNADDIVFAPIREQAALIRSRKLSPVALAEAYIARLETIGPTLGAVVTVTKELGLRQARAAEAEIRRGSYRGLLHGIPYGAKDLLATKGIPTTWGAAPYQHQVFDYDATVIEKLREAGAVLIAKLAMIELAGGFDYGSGDTSFTGPCVTPWNQKHWSGGSSSGSGAAVAAGLVSFAIGSETSGSIISPSTYCGISGLRPTYGRVSRHGAMALSWSLDKVGPMARSADCCGVVLKAIAGADPLDRNSVDHPFDHPEKLRSGASKLRVGFIQGAFAHLQPAVQKNFEEAVAVLRKIATVVDQEVALPDLPFDAVAETIIFVEAASAFADLLESGRATELRDPDSRSGGYAGTMIPAVDYLRAMRLRTRMKHAMHEAYAGYDALICPSLPTVSPPVDRIFADSDARYSNLSMRVIPANNIVGQPGLAVPTGLGEKGLPTGLTFTGRAWSESALLALARLYQRETDWHKKRPPL